MDCPVCKNAMITLELAEVEVDYCTGCKGVWLDAGELEMLLGNGELSSETYISHRPEVSGGKQQRTAS